MFISLLTPTYNRSALLPRLYSSIEAQGRSDLEWVVIDDGSSDDTQNVINALRERSPFEIRYFKKDNGGKHSAINVGMQYVCGEYTFIVDSDDWLPEGSIDAIEKYARQVDESFAGVAGLRSDGNGHDIGTTFIGEYADCTSLERERYGITGDKAEVFKTAVLKEFPFPVFDGEQFLTESVVWFRIAAAGHKIRWFNQIIYCCEYLNGGLTMTRGKFLDNFNGFVCAVSDELKYHEIPTRRKLKDLCLCGAYAISRKEDMRKTARLLDVPYLLFEALAAPIHVYRSIARHEPLSRKREK